jgi:hypothetical protein
VDDGAPLAVGGSDLYDRDFHAWAVRQGALLRERRFEELDLDNVIDEVESLGWQEERELLRQLRGVMLQLLKWQRQPSFQCERWKLAIGRQRSCFARSLSESPSLALIVEENVQSEFELACLGAVVETGLAESSFPEICPWTFDQIIDEAFCPAD